MGLREKTTYIVDGNCQIKDLFAPIVLHQGVTTPVTISGDFKSVGTVPSILYFGIVCYRADGSEIFAHDNIRIEEARLVKQFTAQQILLDEAPKTWFDNTSCGYRRALGFYLSGNTNNTPDYVAYDSSAEQTAEAGAFAMNGDILSLNVPIPSAILSCIVPGQTIVMNHCSSSTYHYGAAYNATLSNEYKTYTATFQMDAFNDAANKYRKDTAKVGLVILANFQQNANAVMHMRNIKLFTEATMNPKY